jgi:hypothetical protein
MFSQKRRAEKQLFAWLKKGKRQPARGKAPWIQKKELLTLTPGDDAEGRNEKAMAMMMMGENQSCWSQVHVTAWVLRVKHQKVGLKRRPNAYTAGGGASVSPYT